MPSHAVDHALATRTLKPLVSLVAIIPRFRVGDSNIPAHTYLCLHPECGLHAQVVRPPPSHTNSAESALHEPA